MRCLVALGLPFVVQILAYVGVFAAARGGGSFMGLLAMPAAGITIPLLLVTGFTGARSSRPLGGIVATNLALALIPPALLLIFRALES